MYKKPYQLLFVFILSKEDLETRKKVKFVISMNTQGKYYTVPKRQYTIASSHDKVDNI